MYKKKFFNTLGLKLDTFQIKKYGVIAQLKSDLRGYTKLNFMKNAI